MKKIVLSLITSILLGFGGNAQNLPTDYGNLYASNDLNYSKVQVNYAESIIVKREWWATCIVDAAGALGGAASVASFINVGSATPLGWGAIAGGAILGGAGASLARVGNIKPIDNGVIILSNKANKLDYVGVKHNQLINDYFENYNEYTTHNYFEFINSNKEKYGIEKNFLTEKYLENQKEIIEKLDSDEKIVNYALKNLPSEIDKTNFKDFLERLKKIDDSENFVNEIKNFENKLLGDKLSDDTKLKLCSFFSTMRYSSNIW